VIVRRLGSAEERVVFEHQDARDMVSLSCTKDGLFVTINLVSKDSSLVYIFDPVSMDLPVVALPRQDKILYFVEHIQGLIYLLINRSADDQERVIFRSPLKSILKQEFDSYEMFYRPEEGHSIVDAEFFKDFIISNERHSTDPRPKLKVISVSNQSLQSKLIETPSWGFHVGDIPNPDHSTSIFGFSVSSPVHSSLDFEYNFEANSVKCLEELKDASRQEQVEIHHAISSDGESIPISIFRREKHLPSPTLMHSYGCYGQISPCRFEHLFKLFFDHGWNIAIPHIRGSGDLGSQWYNAAKRSTKMKTFEDLIACGEFLIQQRVCGEGKLCAMSSSAGALILAGAMNIRPQLFQAVILKVPFLDLINTMKDLDLFLSQHEIEEWGDSRDPKELEVMAQFDPIMNLKPSEEFPRVWIQAGLQDNRTPFWNSLKYVMRLRKVKHEHMDKVFCSFNQQGHFGAGGIMDELKQMSQDFAFFQASMM